MVIDKDGIARNKVWIIYILSCLKFRLKENQLSEICDQFKLMDCFDFNLAINELQSTDLVVCEETVLGRMYSSSELGSSTLCYFQKDLSYTKRQEVKKYLEAESDKLYLDSVIGHDVLKLSNGRYRVVLRIVEKDVESFDLTLYAPDHKQKDIIVTSWHKNALKVYEGVYANLLED